LIDLCGNPKFKSLKSKVRARVVNLNYQYLFGLFINFCPVELNQKPKVHAQVVK